MLAFKFYSFWFLLINMTIKKWLCTKGMKETKKFIKYEIELLRFGKKTRFVLAL